MGNTLYSALKTILPICESDWEFSEKLVIWCNQAVLDYRKKKEWKVDTEKSADKKSTGKTESKTLERTTVSSQASKSLVKGRREDEGKQVGHEGQPVVSLMRNACINHSPCALVPAHLQNNSGGVLLPSSQA